MLLGYSQQIFVLLKRLSGCYLIYFLCRLVLYFANRQAFATIGYATLAADCFWGLRFDTFSILVANSIFILLSLLPIKIYYTANYQAFLKWLFVLTNAVFILTNCIDFGYFAFTKKRSGADLFDLVAGGQTDIIKLLPQYIKDFWWILVIYLSFIFLLVVLYNLVKISPPEIKKRASTPEKLIIATMFLVSAGLVVLGIRGGFQRIPVDVVDAGGMVSPEEVPIVLNTPFTIIKSLDKESLSEYNFFDQEALVEIYDPIHQYQSETFNKHNVIVISLESFAKEYTSLGGTVSYTPFLDSLMRHSLVFTNGYANGSKSIEGIPAILSSLPSLLENPVINSAYAGNYQTTFATVLNSEGYLSAFFHGGINGTMNFDAYAKLAGYHLYFGKNEYNNNKDFDGYWGIWDEEFLQYSIKKMNELPEPFHSSIFTLSSHHPYKIPEKHKNRFPKGHLENSESVGYADYALKQFFVAAKKTKWYGNTLFVLCADHSSVSQHPYFSNQVGLKSIPILFFKGDNSLARRCDSSFSQIDILPSVLNLLGYNKPFFSFGQSFLNRKNNNCYFYDNGTTFVLADTMLFCYNAMELYAVRNLKQDSLLGNNILGGHPLLEEKINKECKAFMQTYNHTLISNTGSVK
jgi:phosphoglycerol transferase MdoB-like AlkP superfamily enzyme